MDAASVPLACRCEGGSPALPEGREYDTGAGIGEGLTGAAAAGLSTLSAAAGARADSAGEGAGPRSPPLGGGLDAVTAGCPF